MRTVASRSPRRATCGTPGLRGRKQVKQQWGEKEGHVKAAEEGEGDLPRLHCKGGEGGEGQG